MALPGLLCHHRRQNRAGAGAGPVGIAEQPRHLLAVGVQDHLEGALIIDVESGELAGRAVTPERSRGVLALPHAWTTPGD